MEKLQVIAHIYNDYKEKFGIPRQSGIIDIESKIIFEPIFRNREAFRGIEQYNYLWLLWEFSESHSEWSPTVRPPKLGGNTRMGVFATRSPFRPNSIGLSSVKLESIEFTKENGPILTVTGADVMNGTPIYDIKPYIKYADCHEDANNGFALSDVSDSLTVEILDGLICILDEEKRNNLIKILSQDPRPAYKCDETTEHGIKFADYDIKFKVKGDILTVTNIEKIKEP